MHRDAHRLGTADSESYLQNKKGRTSSSPEEQERAAYHIVRSEMSEFAGPLIPNRLHG
jgi:hypothetical protein